MFIAIAFFTSVVQYILFYSKKIKGLKFPDFIITLVIIVLYIFVYPQLILNTQQTTQKCGLGFMAVFLAFSILGTLSAIIVHFLWYFKKKHIE